MGLRSDRLPRRQCFAAPRQHAAPLAAHRAAERARRVDRCGGVRGSSPACGIRRLGDRAQGYALGPILSRRVLRLYPFCNGTQFKTLHPRPIPVCAGPVVQVHRCYPARGTADLSLVATWARHRRGSDRAGAVLRGGADRRGRRRVIRRLERTPRPRLFHGRAGTHRGARPVVLRGQIAVAGGLGGHLSPLGRERR